MRRRKEKMRLRRGEECGKIRPTRPFFLSFSLPLSTFLPLSLFLAGGISISEAFFSFASSFSRPRIFSIRNHVPRMTTSDYPSTRTWKPKYSFSPRRIFSALFAVHPRSILYKGTVVGVTWRSRANPFFFLPLLSLIVRSSIVTCTKSLARHKSLLK